MHLIWSKPQPVGLSAIFQVWKNGRKKYGSQKNVFFFGGGDITAYLSAWQGPSTDRVRNTVLGETAIGAQLHTEKLTWTPSPFEIGLKKAGWPHSVCKNFSYLVLYTRKLCWNGYLDALAFRKLPWHFVGLTQLRNGFSNPNHKQLVITTWRTEWRHAVLPTIPANICTARVLQVLQLIDAFVPISCSLLALLTENCYIATWPNRPG